MKRVRVWRELSDRRARRRWSREMHRRLEALDRVDRLHGLGAHPTLAGRRAPRRSPGAFWPSLLVTLVVMVAVLALSPGASTDRIRALVGLGDERLDGVVEARDGRGHFRFALTQPGSDEPVSYNPCREIEYVVNPEGAPEGHEGLVQDSVERISEATGFVFAYAGTTEDRKFVDRGRRSLGGSPVLIGWATSEEVPGLAGNVAGLGGSSAVERTPAHLSYVTGMVALDRDFFAELATRPAGYELQRAIVMHELGHVVGLAHVQDRSELMYDGNLGQTSFGPGDLRGLARLGAVDCQ